MKTRARRTAGFARKGMGKMETGKKFSLMLLAALLALSLWACGGDKKEEGAPSPSPSPSATPTAAPSPSPSAKPKASPSVKPRATKKPSSTVSKEEEKEEASSSEEESQPVSSDEDEGYKDYQADGTPPPNETIEPAEGDEPPVSSKQEEEEPSASPYDFVGSDVNALYGAFGYPGSTSYASSCMGPGEDGILYYDGFTVYTYREDGVETIQSVE